MMAAKNQFNIHTTYYESFFALSVSIRKDKLHQLKLETHRVQAPVLRYRDITFTSEFLKESLSAECLLVGVHNVGRVRHGAQLLMIEVDFTEEKPLERFCKSMSSGMLTNNYMYNYCNYNNVLTHQEKYRSDYKKDLKKAYMVLIETLMCHLSYT